MTESESPEIIRARLIVESGVSRYHRHSEEASSVSDPLRVMESVTRPLRADRRIRPAPYLTEIARTPGERDWGTLCVPRYPSPAS